MGIDSFAAAFDEHSRANPADGLRHLVEQIEHADELGLDAFGLVNTTAASFWIPRRPLFWDQQRPVRNASV